MNLREQQGSQNFTGGLIDLLIQLISLRDSLEDTVCEYQTVSKMQKLDQVPTKLMIIPSP